jgi:hypothetical protein
VNARKQPSIGELSLKLSEFVSSGLTTSVGESFREFGDSRRDC